MHYRENLENPMKHELLFEVFETCITFTHKNKHTHTQTQAEVGVKPFKLNEGLMIDWEWL